MKIFGTIERYLNRFTKYPNTLNFLLLLLGTIGWYIGITEYFKPKSEPSTEVVIINKPIESVHQPINKLIQTPAYKILVLVKGFKGSLAFRSLNKIPLYTIRCVWQGTDAILLILIPNEKSERAYSISNDTHLPFTLMINTRGQTSLFEVENKNDTCLFIRTFSEEGPTNSK